MTWAQYQSSIGEKCQHQPVGLTCYEAKGLILDEFLKVSRDILTLLDDNKEDLEQGLPTTFSVALEGFMVAEVKARFFFSRTQDETITRDQLRPAIAVITVNKVYRQRALSLLKKSQIIDKLPGFNVVGLQKDPATLMSSSSNSSNEDLAADSDENSNTEELSMISRRRMPWGVQVFGSSNSLSGLGSKMSTNIQDPDYLDTKKEYLLEGQCVQLIFPGDQAATLSGTVAVNGKNYGMTVSHVLYKAVPNKGSQTSTEESSVTTDDHDSGDDYDFEGLVNKWSTLSKFGPYRWFNSFESRLSRGSAGVPQGDRKQSVLGDNDIKPKRAHIWARTHYFSQLLLESNFVEERDVKPGIEQRLSGGSYTQLDYTEGPNGSRDLDYDLFSLQSLAEDKPNFGLNLLRKEKVKIVADMSGKPEVLAVTGTTGIVTGHLLERPYFIKMPGKSTSFQLLWAVKLQRKIQPGDCGTWVMSKDSQNLYGHLVAADPHSTIAYLVPAYKVFEHISSIPVLHGGLYNDIVFSRIVQSSLQPPLNSPGLQPRPLPFPSIREQTDAEFVALSKNIHSLISSNIALISLTYWRDSSAPSLGQINIALAGLLLGSAILNAIPLFHGPRKAYGIIVLVLTCMTPLAIFTASSPEYRSYFQHTWPNIWTFLIALVMGGHYPQKGRGIFDELQLSDARYGWVQPWEVVSAHLSDGIILFANFLTTALYMEVIVIRWASTNFIFAKAGDIVQLLHYGLILALTIGTVIICYSFGRYKNDIPYLRGDLQKFATLGFIIDILREFLQFFIWGFLVWEIGSAILNRTTLARGTDTFPYSFSVMVEILGPLYHLGCIMGIYDSPGRHSWLKTIFQLDLPSIIILIIMVVPMMMASDRWATFCLDLSVIFLVPILSLARKYLHPPKQNSPTSQPSSTPLLRSNLTSPSAVAIVGSVAGCFGCQLYRHLWVVIVIHGRNNIRTLFFIFIGITLAGPILNMIMVVIRVCSRVPPPSPRAMPVTPQEDSTISRLATI